MRASHPDSRAIARGLAAAVSTGLALLAAGCGGSSKAPVVASLAPAGQTAPGNEAAGKGPTSPGRSSPATTPSTTAFATCLGAHGFPASPGTGKSGLSIFGVSLGSVDPSSAQFQAALQACRKFLPGGGPPSLTPAQQAEHTKALAAFAGCMRKNGVASFPDPDGQGQFPVASIGKLDPKSPGFQAAYKACEPLLPTFGPRIEF